MVYLHLMILCMVYLHLMISCMVYLHLMIPCHADCRPRTVRDWTSLPPGKVSAPSLGAFILVESKHHSTPLLLPFGFQRVLSTRLVQHKVHKVGTAQGTQGWYSTRLVQHKVHKVGTAQGTQGWYSTRLVQHKVHKVGTAQGWYST